MLGSSKIGKGAIVGATCISAMLIVLVFLFMVLNSWQALSLKGLQLFTLEWHPAKAKFGIVSMVYGSVAVTMIALGLALPLGILTAVFTSEVLPARFRLSVKSLLEILAGIPSIIYGLLGVVFLGVWIEHLFDLQSGRTILTGGLLLAIMVLPTVITLSDDAFHNVPQAYREAAQSLGLYRYEVVKDVVWPFAKTEIVGAVLLGFGRVLGETMAVMLVIGSMDKIPEPIYNFLLPGQTITSKLGREIAESAFGSLHFSAMIFMGLFLLFFVLLITIVSLTYFSNLERRLYE